MVEHVRRRAVLSGGFSEVVVATCDERIREAIEPLGAKVAMTSASHVAASDRVAEAAERLSCTHVVNIQGDEPLVLPEDLLRMTAAIRERPDIQAWNAVAKIDEKKELADRTVVKCVVSRKGRVLYCSRDFSGLPLRNGAFDPVRKILGILGYHRNFLGRFTRMERTPLECLESIDQSRVVEHDEPLWGVEFSRGFPSINIPEDAQLVESCLSGQIRQGEVLRQVMSLGYA